MSKSRRCPYCQTRFFPSVYRPQQVVCSQPECQRGRRADYHRNKLTGDPEYRQVVLESQKKWRDNHPEYQKKRRQANPQVVEKNRQRQRQRDRKRRLQHLVKNNLALDLKHSVSEVWLLGPKLHDLDKNNLAAYSGDVNGGFQRDVDTRSGDVNKVGAQRRWVCNHA